MPDTFLHGVETITSTSLAVVNNVKTAVIGLIGTGGSDFNNVFLSTNEADDELLFDDPTSNIRTALSAIRTQGSATVFIVSVGDGQIDPTGKDFNGAVDPTTGARTGLKLFDECQAKYGFSPKIFIAPGFSTLIEVAAALIVTATKFRGIAYLDAPEAITVSGAKALRETGGLWDSVDIRAKLFYPRLKDATGTLVSYSAIAAGNRAQTDLNDGFWVSSSNHTLTGVTGSETVISSAINDPLCDANTLNELGITTVFNAYGTGFREWGNRNASFPTSTDATSFECVQRTKDIIDESIEMAMLPYIDKPIIQAYIDSVKMTVNNYFNTLIAKGALLEGSKCTYESSKNSTAELAKGHVVFTTVYMSPTPAERITFDTSIDTSLLDTSIDTNNLTN